ncbi:MAG: polyphosphate kinase 2 family protein [Candidatus Obscuribacterales bacterium]|nr:polyphosphate kinase 2 family protein [Candidatus Obscuribacterales bacterium]
MKNQPTLKRIEKFVEPYRITNGKGFKLSSIDPGDTQGLGTKDKQEAAEMLREGVEWLADEQGRLYAQDRWSLLLIFQAMDAAGKDGTIKHVMSGVNPQGCQVFSFKQPTAEDLDHDYMWRYLRSMPERGRIGIFNRSYYEEVLIVRVHQEILAQQRLDPSLITKNIWEERLHDIRSIEEYLGRNGVAIIKFYLHLSPDEQKKRFLDRLVKPEKNWKYSSSDLKERQYWKDYMKAYESAISATASEEAPWYVVPADNKWFTRLVVAGAIVERLERLKLKYPEVPAEKQKELEEALSVLNGSGPTQKNRRKTAEKDDGRTSEQPKTKAKATKGKTKTVTKAKPVRKSSKRAEQESEQQKTGRKNGRETGQMTARKKKKTAV